MVSKRACCFSCCCWLWLCRQEAATQHTVRGELRGRQQQRAWRRPTDASGDGVVVVVLIDGR